MKNGYDEMVKMINDRLKNKIGVILPLLISLLIIWRWIKPERSLQATGITALADLVFSLLLLGAILLLSAGIGRKIISLRKDNSILLEEKNLFAVILGFGILGNIILYLGVIGALTQQWIFGLLILTAVFLVPETGAFIFELIAGIKTLINKIPKWKKPSQILFGVAICIVLLCILRAIAPPWDPDGLIYHLQAPKLFLQQSRVSFISGNVPANYPLLPEMVFLIGLVLQCDTLARLLHLVFFGFFLLLTFLFARRVFNRRIAWISLLVNLSMPILPFWGTLAYTDYMWAVFQFLSFYALLMYFEKRETLWLLIAGLAGGFAMESKYLALGGIAILCVWALWMGRKEWKKTILYITGFGLLVLLLALPWYIKNIIAVGNPFYPLSLGLSGITTGASGLWQGYMQNGFGTGRTLLDYLLLPWNLFAQHEKFATVGGTIEIPGFLYPFALFSLLIKEKRIIYSMGFIVIGWFVFWAAGSQQIRFLLPLFPALSVMAAVGINYLMEKASNPRLWRAAGFGIAGGILAVNLFYQIVDTLATRPWGPALGLESKESFLQRMVTDYGATQFVMENVPSTEKVLSLWDGRSYYCDTRCEADTTHYQWTWLTRNNPPAKDIAKEFRDQGITHLMFSGSDLTFLLRHDPGGWQYGAWIYLENVFVPSCAREVYHDKESTVWEITCA